jgi:hypothetical protein
VSGLGSRDGNAHEVHHIIAVGPTLEQAPAMAAGRSSSWVEPGPPMAARPAPEIELVHQVASTASGRS